MFLYLHIVLDIFCTKKLKLVNSVSTNSISEDSAGETEVKIGSDYVNGIMGEGSMAASQKFG